MVSFHSEYKMMIRRGRDLDMPEKYNYANKIVEPLKTNCFDALASHWHTGVNDIR